MNIGWHRNVKVTGNLVKGKPHGQVKLIINNFSNIENATFEGAFVNGVVNGQGILTLHHRDGRRAVVRGKFRGNNFVPTGTMTYTTQYGDEFVGTFRNGKPRLYGKVIYFPGHVYQGALKWHFVNYIGSYVYPHGSGKMNFRNGSYYDGNWVNSKVQGNGTYFDHSDGSTVTGTFEGGVNGRGVGRITCRCVLYSYYEGFFRNAKPDGFGRYVYPNGDVYEGRSLEGSKYSNYVVYYANGDVYRGSFSRNTMHGKGTYTYRNGRTEQREYEYGVRKRD